MGIRALICVLLTVFSMFSMWGGQSIVPSPLKEHKDFSIASKFIEHYYALLKQARTEAVEDTLRQIRENGVKYTVGNETKWASMKGDEEFNLRLTDGLYSACWSRGGKEIVAFSFPARIDLLTMSNKIRLEEMMLARLRNPVRSEQSNKKPTVQTSCLREVPFSTFHVYDAGFFITPRLTHQVIYQPLDSISSLSELLTDSSVYSLECISNILLTGYSAYPITVKVNFDQYGGQSSSVNLGFTELYEILSSEGSVPYWGVDNCDGRDVKGLYVWLNNAGGFAHVLSLELPMTAMSAPSEAKAKIYCYIRLDNLKSLFEEYK